MSHQEDICVIAAKGDAIIGLGYDTTPQDVASVLLTLKLLGLKDDLDVQYLDKSLDLHPEWPCIFFARGFCKKGNLCPFSHELYTHNHYYYHTHQQVQTTNTDNLSMKSRFFRQRCFFFDNESCKKGYGCPFKHGENACIRCEGMFHDERHCAQCFICHKWGHVAMDCQKK